MTDNLHLRRAEALARIEAHPAPTGILVPAR